MIIKQKIRNISTRVPVWVSAIPMVILFTILTFVLIPNLQKLIGNMQLLDTSFGGYDAAYVHQLFDKLGNNGRKAYLSMELFADIPFICLYVLTFTTIIIRLLLKNDQWNSVLSYSLLLPVFAGIFDLIEDIGIIGMLVNKELISTGVWKLTAVCTNLKGLLLGLTFLAMLLQLVGLGLNRIRKY
ncbi:hypothetical protein [Chitinophaga sp. CB10]|uniref:hypothetical protein n=1 Tax=Chitinophaga sp. CB10 TaxID=1891659 RepID=UPI0025C53090|nr:hypothetical protein [Chitinophaga sp. CB10]